MIDLLVSLRPHAPRARRASFRRWSSLTLIALSVAVHGCASATKPAASDEAPVAPVTRALLPEGCEQRVDDLYRTPSAVRIQALGTRYILTFGCQGMHGIYLARTQVMDYAPYVSQPICARYRYIEEARPSRPCLKPPCPDSERGIQLVEVRRANGPEAACTAP